MQLYLLILSLLYIKLDFSYQKILELFLYLEIDITSKHFIRSRYLVEPEISKKKIL